MRLATPRANMTSMSAQQQPTQNAPWSRAELEGAGCSAFVVAVDERGGVAA